MILSPAVAALNTFDPTATVALGLCAAFVFGLSGGLAGVRAKLDPFGVLVIAAVVGLAGSVSRDLLIGRPPATFRDWRYLAILGGAGLLTLIAAPFLERIERAIEVLDAAGLSLNSVTGASIAVHYRLAAPEALLLGAISGIGGGMMRDLLLGRVPEVLRGGLSAVPALIGAGIAVAASGHGRHGFAFSLLGAGACFTLRIIAIRYDLNLPTVRHQRSATLNDNNQLLSRHRAPGAAGRARIPLMQGEGHVRIVKDRFLLAGEDLQDLRERLVRARLPPDLGSGWERGMPRDWLRGLLEDWRAFDADAFQHRLDGLSQLRAELDGQTLHVVHAQGRGPEPLPLLMTHGWPGSFLEYLSVLPQLSDPGAHGGDPADAFTVIVPSLPGFGFSGPPPSAGLTARQVARLWHALLTAGLGHDRYVAHDSDLGAGVTAWLARDQPQAVAAIHLATPGLAPIAPPGTAAEEKFAAAVEAWTAEEGGYAHEHATKPGTLGAALSDSPSGLAAWVGEKVISWSSARGDGSPAFDRELLLSTLTLYWVTGTITTSQLPYWAYRHSPDAAFPADDPSAVPTVVTIFGGERVPFPKPPRELAERYYTVASWAEHSAGGHFPAVAEPELFVQSIRDAFRSAR